MFVVAVLDEGDEGLVAFKGFKPFRQGPVDSRLLRIWVPTFVGHAPTESDEDDSFRARRQRGCRREASKSEGREKWQSDAGGTAPEKMAARQGSVHRIQSQDGVSRAL